MGSCCFTPTKRDFIWWYWLLLVSIVGIPMLLAVLYVSSNRAGDEEAKKRLGERAAYIFWCGIIGTALLAGLFVSMYVPRLEAQRRLVEESDPVYWTFRHDVYGDHNLIGYRILVFQFITALVFAASANELARKHKWYARIPLLALCVTLYLAVLVFFGCACDFFPINVIQFFICMYPVRCWGEFKIDPTPDRAWKALWAFVVAAPVFFLVVYSGEGYARKVFEFYSRDIWQ